MRIGGILNPYKNVALAEKRSGKEFLALKNDLDQFAQEHDNKKGDEARYMGGVAIIDDPKNDMRLYWDQGEYVQKPTTSLSRDLEDGGRNSIEFVEMNKEYTKVTVTEDPNGSYDSIGDETVTTYLVDNKTGALAQFE